MNFSIKNIVLWLRNGSIRKLQFKPNKVNVITGNSNTGKTAIMAIIDYCLFASKPQISESIINENVEWYGISFIINDKIYTIARNRPIKSKASEEYFFSSVGEIPESTPVANNSGKSIQKIIEKEFHIDSDVTIPFGGQFFKQGSKISLRYFMMFNTISGNIIENDSGIFFDKQSEARYREALPRIFDIAVGIESIENVLKKEKKKELEKNLAKEKKKALLLREKKNLFQHEIAPLIEKAKSYSLIDETLSYSEAIEELKKLEKGLLTSKKSSDKKSKLERERLTKERKIRNLRKFQYEYTNYKNKLKNIEDSLLPIEHLKAKDDEILKSSIFGNILEQFEEQLQQIREACIRKTPIDIGISDSIKSLQKEVNSLNEELSIFPKEYRNFTSEEEKHIFIGQLIAQFNFFSPNSKHLEGFDSRQKELQEQINSIEIEDTENQREFCLDLIEDFVLEYIQKVKASLENYKDYLPKFDYKNKSLKLRKPKEQFIEHVGSSSNHMFLHLFQMLALHELIFHNKSPYVAPYLIIDQPSRPYYGNNNDNAELPESDESKIRSALTLLDEFISDRKKSGGNFQIILFEHVPSESFQNLPHTHLVEEFTGANALIPKSLL